MQVHTPQSGSYDTISGDDEAQTPLNERIENDKIVKEIYVENESPGQRLHNGEYTEKAKRSGASSSNLASTIKLGQIASIIETPTTNKIVEMIPTPEVQVTSGQATQEGSDFLPNLRQVNKQPSLQELSIMKEQQKIREFFSKNEEERDSIANQEGKIPKIKQQKLPVVTKNLRHQQKVVGKTLAVSIGASNKKATQSLISRHYQQRDVGSFQNSLFSEASNEASRHKHEGQGPPESTKYIANMLQHQPLTVKAGRYQTIDVQKQVKKEQQRRSQLQMPTANTDVQFSSLSGLTHKSTTLKPNGVGVGATLPTATGDSKYEMSHSVGKGSIDSLMHPSLMHANFKQHQMRSLHQQLKATNNYSVSLMQPIKLDGEAAIVSKNSRDYSQLEPVIKTAGQRSLEQFKFFGSGPNGDFDRGQSKIYQAIKAQQFQQSRQIINDHLVPAQLTNSFNQLENTYKRSFMAKIGAGSKRLRGGASSKHAQSQAQMVQEPNAYYGHNTSIQQQSDSGQHDIMENFSTKDKLNIQVLLKDQYSASHADHNPGEEDPLTALNVNYDDKGLTKQRRIESTLASLKLKRRTKFKAIPVKRSTSVQGYTPNLQLKDSVGSMASPSSARRKSQDTFYSQKKDKASQQSKEKQSERGGQFDLGARQISSDQKFQMFRSKMQKAVEEQDYFSQSNNSDGVEEEVVLEDEKKDENFLKRSVVMQKEGKISLLKIIKKLIVKRDTEEKQHLVCHLKFRVPFFRDYTTELITTLVDKLECKVFLQGESLMDQGEVGDCMYIVYTGECGVYIFDKQKQKQSTRDSGASSHRAVAIVGANTVIGETAVVDKFDSGKRSATVLAHTEVVTLILTKADYQRILYQYQVMEKMRRLEFLSHLNFFNKWDRVNLVDFNNLSEELKLTQGSTIYDIGQDSSTFYVVRRGKLIMETIIEIDSYFRYPVANQVWEVRKETRQIKYKLQDLWKGAFFGHEEILQGFNRRCRVRCLTDCSLIYVSGQEIKDRWPQDQILELKKNMRSMDLDYMVSKMDRFYKERTKRNTALLDASRLNAHDFSGARSHFMQNNKQTQIDKMLPWINKCRQNNTKDQNLLHELRKIKLLSTKEEKFYINKGDDKEKVPTDEFLEKKHARFVVPQEAESKTKVQAQYIKGLNNKKIKDHSTPQVELKSSTNLTSLKRQSTVLIHKTKLPTLEQL